MGELAGSEAFWENKTVLVVVKASSAFNAVLKFFNFAMNKEC